MKYLYLLLLSFIIYSCSNNKEVYWCGDHACINKKERRIYFSETMIVEVREKDKNSKLNKSERDEILKEIKLKDKKYTKKIKKNNNDSFVKENELIIKEIKNKQTKNSEVINENTKKKNKEIVEKKKKKFSKKKDDKILLSDESGLSTFNDLANKISKRNESKDYPDINNIESDND